MALGPENETQISTPRKHGVGKQELAAFPLKFPETDCNHSHVAMKASVACRCLLTILPWMLVSQESKGVIVAGTLGTGNNNNTQAGLDSFLSDASGPAFPYWQNLIRVSDASGVYLGFNPVTSYGWVLSANHVTTPTSITVGGNSYSVQSGHAIGTTDLKLYKIGGGMSDPALPGLASVPLASSAALAGNFTLMFGRGFTTSTSAPYPWGTPDTNDANGMRWGTNYVSGTATVNSNLYLVTDFSSTSYPFVTPYEAQGALGDSGGGMFIYRSGQWELSGIAHFVDDGPDFLEPQGAPTGDNQVNPSEIGDFTAYSDIHWKLSDIQSITGTLVPEPSSLWFVLSGFGLLWRRKR